MVVEEPQPADDVVGAERRGRTDSTAPPERGKTVHGEAANAGHRVLAPDDAEVEAYLETALNAPARIGPPTTARRRSRTPVVVLDFGSQFAQLIARRVRELNVYSELLPHDTPWAEIERRAPKAIILSGGPNSVYDDDAPAARPGDLARRRSPSSASATAPSSWPTSSAATSSRPTKREYGPATVTITTDDGLFTRPRPRPAGLDEPRRLDHPPPDRLPPDRPDRLVAVRRPRRRSTATSTASSSTPRSSTRRAAGTCSATSSSASPAPSPTWTAGQLHRPDRRRDPRAASTTTPPRPARTGSSSAPCRAASTRRSPRRSSIGRSGTG